MERAIVHREMRADRLGDAVTVVETDDHFLRSGPRLTESARDASPLLGRSLTLSQINPVGYRSWHREIGT